MKIEKPRSFKGFGSALPRSIIDRSKLYKEMEAERKKREESLIERLKKNPYGGERKTEETA